MRHDDFIRLRHMLDSARKASEFARGRSGDDLRADEMLGLALVRLLEVLGEAAKGISEELRAAHPEIPWKQIAGTRNRLIHGYFDVDLNIVWQIVNADLPPLISVLNNILASESL